MHRLVLLHVARMLLTVLSNVTMIRLVLRSIFVVNKITVLATADIAVDKEAVGLSRVHMYESKQTYSIIERRHIAALTWDAMFMSMR